MRLSNQLLLRGVLVFLFALAFAIATVSHAYAGDNWQTPCEGNGGTWTGPNGYTGTCTYPSGSSMADGNCSPGESYEEYFLAGNPNGSQCIPPSSTPVTAEANCTAANGTWSGVDADNGECTYAEGNATALSFCGAGYEYSETFVAGSSTGTQCTFVGSTSDDDASDSDDENAEGDTDRPVTLSLGGGHNGSATFPPGSCPQKCTISSGLPAAAKDSLPSDAEATMYVRVVDEGGNPGTGTYTVCFKNPDGKPLKIYRFIGGAWVAVAVTTGGPVCTTASGDGAFYLGS